MRYDMLENNCEAWARMIVEGTPRSTQSDRISSISKTLYKLDNMFGKADLRGHTSIKQEAKRLDLWWRRINGDGEATQELNAFTELINLGKRTDTKSESSGLPSVEAILPRRITDPEAVQRIKMYLMLAISSSSVAQREAKARKDNLALAKFRVRTTNNTTVTARRQKGKPCGESFIPKTHECKQKRGSQIAKVALTAGVIAGSAYALKKAKVGEFHTGLGTSDPFRPVRLRRFTWMQKNQKSMSSEEIANVFEGLKSQKGVIAQNVQALQDFVKTRNIVNNPATVIVDMEQGLAKTSIGKDSKQIMKKADTMIKLGAFDGLASTAADNIYVRSSRKDNSNLNPDPGEMVAASARFMDRRGEAQGRQRPSMTERYKRLFSVARNSTSGDVHEALLHIHEISHKVHFQASLNRGGSNETIVRNIHYDPLDQTPFLDKVLPSQQKGNNVDFESFYKDIQQRKKTIINQLEAATSEYGRSDVKESRTETFAELSVLYVTQGTRFKREFPLAYAWVDDIWTEARQAHD
jgi:alkylhydroperoxidase/carboxymuconolactone decarboxylase family protein YurZ